MRNVPSPVPAGKLVAGQPQHGGQRAEPRILAARGSALSSARPDRNRPSAATAASAADRGQAAGPAAWTGAKSRARRAIATVCRHKGKDDDDQQEPRHGRGDAGTRLGEHQRGKGDRQAGEIE